ncbi:hypothetical protein [Actinoplanes sp. G11-F43]|uniref:hypothetical protein n=1 Tax=Actinoplanes sp. G11-F43 TaxID=3424130 RepID=UPI003D34FD2A
MTEHQDRLREAFTKYENDTPDPAAVYARVEELARKHTWRRRGAQAAGGVALSAGLIAGVTQLPAILPGGPVAPATAPAFEAAAPAATPGARATIPPDTVLTEAQISAGIDAFFEAGFGYDNAVELADLWKLDSRQVGQIKGIAGHKLLAGETLPVQPVPNSDSGGEAEPVDPEAQKQISEYFYAGYGWEEAEKLAEIWNLADPGEAKYEAGKRLLAGEELPVKVSKEQAAEGKKSRGLDKFFEAGYDYEDAVELAGIWKLDSPYDAKVEGGVRLLDGKKLPIKP